MRHHTIPAVTLICAAIAITAACSTPQATVTAHTTTVSPPTTTIRRGEINDADRAFLSTLTDYWKDSADRATLIQAGEAACSQMRDGQKLQLIATLAHGTIDGAGGVTGDATAVSRAGEFLYSAAIAYCPDQLSGVH